MVAPMVPAEYGKFRERGADPLTALAAGTGMAGVEYITEKLPMGVLVNKFGRVGAGQFLRELLARCPGASGAMISGEFDSPELLEAEAEGYIVLRKPVDPDELHALLSTWFDHRMSPSI